MKKIYHCCGSLLDFNSSLCPICGYDIGLDNCIEIECNEKNCVNCIHYFVDTERCILGLDSSYVLEKEVICEKFRRT